MAGRLKAAGFVALFVALGLLLPPASVIAGGIIALAALRHGLFEALGVTTLAALIIGALGLATLGQPWYGLGVLAMGVPMAALGEAVRRTGRLITGFYGAALVGVAVVLGLHALLGAPAEWWAEFIGEVVAPGDADGLLAGETDPEGLVDRAAMMMTGVLGGALFLSLTLSLFLARWGHAVLENPGGFRNEFHGLRLPPAAVVAALLVIGLAALQIPGIAGLAVDLAVLAGSAFLVAGVALVHGLLGATGSHGAWLIAFYGVLVIFLPQAVLLVAGMGLVDGLADFRSRLAASRG